MTYQLIPTGDNSALAMAGQVANHQAARGLFGDYRMRKAANTRRRQDGSLTLFAAFLGAAGIPGAPTAAELAGNPASWRGVTWGLVAAFVRWLLDQGYAIGSTNGHLSTLKTYARLAMQAGELDRGEYVAIRATMGYTRAEGKRVDEGRVVARIGAKKAEAVPLTPDQASRLKLQPDTPQGRRDAVLVALLVDHGLRVGELARLTVGDLDLGRGELRFYRPEVDRDQTHALTPDAWRAVRAYVDAGDCPGRGGLLRASRKGGALTGAGMSERAITERVRELGAAVGLVGLSAHDLRHAWATRAARNGTPLDRLQDAGGWSSPAMPLRYVETAKIANQGVRLDG